MVLALTLLSGIAWTVVYVFAIRIGFQQRTYAIPAAALALNIAWETIYASRGLATADFSVQTFVNLAWAAWRRREVDRHPRSDDRVRRSRRIDVHPRPRHRV